MARTTCQTGLAAAMATAAELARRGYDVAFTMGNTPKVDLLCSVPGGDLFKVQVKGVSNANGLVVHRPFFNDAGDRNLFLVVVLVQPATPCRSGSTFYRTRKRGPSSRRCRPTRRTDGPISTTKPA